MSDRFWQGIGVSAGYAAGPVWVLAAFNSTIIRRDEQVVDTEVELGRLEEAVAITDQNLTKYEHQVSVEKGEEFARIFTAQRLLLTDPSFIGKTRHLIEKKSLPAERALAQVAEEAMKMLRSLSNSYFQERAIDVQDVSEQIIAKFKFAR